MTNGCCVNDFSSISRTYLDQSAIKSFNLKIDYFLFRTLNQNKYELNDLRFLFKCQLDSLGINSMTKNTLNNIALKQQLTSIIMRELNTRYQNMGLPERVIRNREGKILIDYMIEKYQR